MFLSFTCDILGYVSPLVANDANSILPFTYIFRGTGATMFLRAMMGPPLDKTLCGAKRERGVKNTAERERERSGERGLQKEA